METAFWFVESFRLNPGGKNGLCCVTAVSTSVFDLRVNKTTSKIYLFQFGLFSVLRAEDLGANLTFGAASPESLKARMERVWKISYLEANLSRLTALSLGPLSH